MILLQARFRSRIDDPTLPRMLEELDQADREIREIAVPAEESGVTRANVAPQKASEDPVVQRLLGIDWITSQALGLPNKDWAATVISALETAVHGWWAERARCGALQHRDSEEQRPSIRVRSDGG